MKIVKFAIDRTKAFERVLATVEIEPMHEIDVAIGSTFEASRTGVSLQLSETLRSEIEKLLEPLVYASAIAIAEGLVA